MRRRAELVLIASGLLTLPSVGGACSMRPGFNYYMVPTTAMMLATATADTMLAGAGSVQWTLAPGHNGPTRERPIYGQVIRVDSATGPGARSGSRVVLVPWDYGPDCRPTPWGNAATWRRLGTYGLYTAQLRDSVHWAGGLPTYDVFVPEFQPYTNLRGGAGAERDSLAATMLTPEEMFAVAKILPVVPPRSFVDSVAHVFVGWARANPALVARPPLNSTLRYAEFAAERGRVRRIDAPIRGTYRVTFVLNGADSAVFYGRTERGPDAKWDGKAMLTRGSDAMSAVAGEGYVMLLWLAKDSAGLARPQNNGYLYVSHAPSSVEAGRRTWIGSFPPSMIRTGTADAPPTSATLQLSPMVAATFTIGPDGAAYFEHRSTLPDGRTILIRGVRISHDVF